MPFRPTEKLIEVRPSTIQGQGVFAAQRIRKGTRIIEYTGERISHEEADRRYDDASMARHHTFLFTVDEHTVIDAAVGGNEARFINHSCDPNCETVLEGKRIFVYAIRDIPAGAELLYDYRYEREGGWDEADAAMYPCYCGAKNCRGTILLPPSKPARTRSRTNAKAKTKTKTKKAVRRAKGTKGARAR